MIFILTLCLTVFLSETIVKGEDGYEDTEEDQYENADDEDTEDDTAKSMTNQYQPAEGPDGYHEDGYEPQDSYESGRSYYKPEKEKVYVPVYIPEKEKKKMKIISVDKGFYIMGGTQIAGKFRTLKACMKACAITPTCFAGDFNPWLHKCYMHTNYTACNTLRSHPQYVHFSKVPCSLVDAPTGRITLGAQVQNGIEIKGIDSLQQCIKKCVAAGGGVPASAATLNDDVRQACFAIDYDFATHKCFFFGSNIVNSLTSFLHCVIPLPAGVSPPTSIGAIPNPTVIHITFCPKGINFG